MSPTAQRVIWGLKAVVTLYWAWVLGASLGSERSTFDAIVVLSAPALLSLHFMQGLLFIQRLRAPGPWWSDFGQIMLFGVLHLVTLQKRRGA